MAQYILTENSITVFNSSTNRPVVIDNTHTNFKAVEDAIKDGKSEEIILDLMDIATAVIKFADKSEVSRGNVEIKDGEIFYMGEVVHSSLANRILSLMEKGFDITPFTNFMENLYLNPSFRAVNETYGFLEACNLPITEDGCFLAYKKINEDYTDCYTGKIDNSIGAKPSMLRCKVNEDKNQTCSTGLHVASFSYMASYSGARTVICKVNPRDVVSVPVDYNNAKMRVCQYEVINEVKNLVEEITDGVISDDEAYSDEYSKDEVYDDGSIPDLLNQNDENDDHEPMSDEDYGDIGSTPYYETCEDMLEDIDGLNLEECIQTYSDIPEAIKYLNSITTSTSFWKKQLIDILHLDYGFDNCFDEDENEQVFYTRPRTAKMKFTIALENYLSDYTQVKADLLMNFLNDNGLENTVGLVNVSLKLGDKTTVITKLKSLAKEGKFKKKALLKSLGI